LLLQLLLTLFWSNYFRFLLREQYLKTPLVSPALEYVLCQLLHRLEITLVNLIYGERSGGELSQKLLRVRSLESLQVNLSFSKFLQESCRCLRVILFVLFDACHQVSEGLH
jgi:hypothetical protein